MGRERGRESHEIRRRIVRRRRDVWVFAEGELTEPQYVDLVKDLQPERRNDVHIVNDSRRDGGRRGSGGGGSDRKPSDLVEAAIVLKRRLDQEASRAGVPDSLMPAVWCIFDRDRHEGIDEAIARALGSGVNVAFSHPCFELWRLLHHQPYTATFGGVCDDAARRLPFAVGMTAQQRKAVSMDQIQGGFVEARKRAIRINDQHGDHVPISQRDPYTDVWAFVEDLGIASY